MLSFSIIALRHSASVDGLELRLSLILSNSERSAERILSYMAKNFAASLADIFVFSIIYLRCSWRYASGSNFGAAWHTSCTDMMKNARSVMVFLIDWVGVSEWFYYYPFMIWPGYGRGCPLPMCTWPVMPHTCAGCLPYVWSVLRPVHGGIILR